LIEVVGFWTLYRYSVDPFNPTSTCDTRDNEPYWKAMVDAERFAIELLQVSQPVLELEKNRLCHIKQMDN
jgi:hypothetical protein